MTRLNRGGICRRANICSLRAQADEKRETLLTDEQCDILQLPRGTKLVGDMSEDMELRLSASKRGTYEDTNQLRYFSNEKFRKENYFGKQKLQVNAKRMAAKVRRAEIEERMDAGYSYDQAVKEVDAIIKANNEAAEAEDMLPPPQPQGTKPLESTLRELFQLVDKDQSGTITAGEMATAFSRLRAPGADQSIILQDVWAVMDAADMDQNGVVDFEEFKSVAETFMQMAPGQPLPKKQGMPNPFGALGKLFGR